MEPRSQIASGGLALDDLPPDVLAVVFSMLDVGSLMRARQACRLFRELGTAEAAARGASDLTCAALESAFDYSVVIDAPWNRRRKICFELAVWDTPEALVGPADQHVALPLPPGSGRPWPLVAIQPARPGGPLRTPGHLHALQPPGWCTSEHGPHGAYEVEVPAATLSYWSDWVYRCRRYGARASPRDAPESRARGRRPVHSSGCVWLSATAPDGEEFEWAVHTLHLAKWPLPGREVWVGYVQDVELAV